MDVDLALAILAVLAAAIALMTRSRRSRAWSLLAFLLAAGCAALHPSHLAMVLAAVAFVAPAVRWAISALWDAAE
jgi:hypothetical protein